MQGPLQDIFGEEYDDVLVRVARGWLAVVAVSAAAAIAVAPAATPGMERGTMAVLFALLAPYFFGIVAIPRFARWVLRHLFPLMGASCATTVALVALAGPQRQEAFVVVPAFLATAFVAINRWQAFAMYGVSSVGYAVVLAIGEGYDGALSRWLVAVGFTGGCLLSIDWAMGRLRDLAVDERAASAEVARLNAELATRVDDLGRFLSPQVAAAVRDLGDRRALEPHRRQIAVLFCDLRGFTGFTGGAEPEEVVEVLSTYYTAVGTVAHAHDATIGSFIGDGVMAYFGDPVPVDDAVHRALATALELRAPLDDLVATWRRHGFDLGYGIGVAYGYATLGTVGFEGRRDYTALGTVVNLASRLCGEAAHGEVLLDARAVAALGQEAPGEPVELALKGFTGPVSARRVRR